jgi:hypothetical protein
MIFLQDDGLALLGRQVLHGLGDFAAQFRARGKIFNGFDRTTLDGRILEGDPLGHCHKRRAALLTHPVAAQVHRDSIEPGRKLGVSLEAGQCPERAQKRLLSDVARVFLTSERAVGESKDRALPSPDELIEALGVAGLRSGNQLFVGPRHRGYSRHGRHSCRPLVTILVLKELDDFAACLAVAPKLGRKRTFFS